MKKLLLLILLSTHTILNWAQPNSENTLIVNDAKFEKNASIKITTSTTAIVTIGTENNTIPISIKDGIVKLDDKKYSQEILSKLKVPSETITKTYQQYGDIDNLERLLTRASELEQRTLYIQSSAPPIHQEEEILVNPQIANGEQVEDGVAWYWLVIIGTAGLLLGYFLSSFNKKNKTMPIEIEVEEDAQQLAIISKEDIPIQQEDGKKPKSNVNINQLKTKYDKLREDSKILKQSYTDLKRNHKELKANIDKDNAYYNMAYQDIVLPLQQALDQGNLTLIYKYQTIAAIQFSAITRAKLTKKQNYDITNIDTLLKNKTDHNSYPELTQHTPIDKTPAQLRNVISVLKQLGVKDLDNYILHGYKLNDL